MSKLQTKQVGQAAAQHAVGRISGVLATDSKIAAAEKAIATAKAGGLPTKAMENMLAKYRKANPEEAAAHDAAKAKPAKAAPKADVVPTGVAKGAETQPHTKQAVREARAAEKQAFDTVKDQMVAQGLRYYLDPARNVAKWLAPDGKLPIGALQLYPVPKAAKALAAPKADAKPRAAAPKGDTPKAKTPRVTTTQAYKVLNRNHGAKPGSKRAAQLEIVFAHTDTASAKAKGAESVDFAFAVAKGFIAYTK